MDKKINLFELLSLEYALAKEDEKQEILEMMEILSLNQVEDSNLQLNTF